MSTADRYRGHPKYDRFALGQSQTAVGTVKAGRQIEGVDNDNQWAAIGGVSILKYNSNTP